MTNINESGKWKKCRMLFWGFFKIASLVVGGGYAIVPAAENEFVHRKKLLSENEMLDMMAIIQSLPGIIAGNAALYIGYRSAGVAGALAGLLGVATPSTLIILLIAVFLHNINLNVPVVQGAFVGAQAAITGLIAMTAVRMVRKNIKNAFTLLTALAAVAAAIAGNVSPGWIILGGAVCGIIYRLSAKNSPEFANTDKK